MKAINWQLSLRTGMMSSEGGRFEITPNFGKSKAFRLEDTQEDVFCLRLTLEMAKSQATNWRRQVPGVEPA